MLVGSRKDTSLPIESNDPPQKVAAEETSATTTFIGSGVASTQPINDTPALSLINHSTTGYVQEITSFLEKPVQIFAGSFTTLQTSNQVITSFDVPDVILTNTMVSQKLTGYQGLRGTIVIKLVSSSNPFQQGRLFMWFYPLANMDPTYIRRLPYIQHTTQFPHVELDVACDSECTLEIPFVSPDLWYDLVGGRDHLGVVGISVMLPLMVGAGSNTVGLTCYAYFKPGTVELVNPTYYEPAIAPLPKGMKPQATKGNSKKKGGPANEKEQILGTYSGMFKALSDTATMVGEGIPMLKPVSGPVAWVSNLSSKALSAFGWSKPSDESAWQRMTRDFTIPHIFNHDGVVIDAQMGFSTMNKLQYYDNVGGNNYDEMVFDNILTRFAVWGTYSFTTATAKGTRIATFQLRPSEFTDASPGGGYFFNLPVGLFSKLFKYWRGKFRMRIKFAKTEYHNAKLAVAFFPGVTSVNLLASTQWVHREIIDLATGNEWTFEFPFTHQVPYIDTTVSYGCVYLGVVNELIAPDTCSSTVQFVVEWCLAPGSEWIRPHSINVLPDNRPIILPIAHELKPLPSGNLKLPKGMQVQSKETCKLHEDGSFNVTGQKDFQLDTAAACVGERLTSAKQLIRVGSPYFPVSGTASYRINPYVVCGSQGAAAKMIDYYNVFQSMFRYQRGGFCTTLVMNVATGNHTPIISRSCNGSLNTLVQSGVTIDHDMSPIDDIINAGHGTWTLPAWQTAPLRLPAYEAQVTTGYTDLFNDTVVELDSMSQTLSFQIQRQPREDFSMHFFLGTPPYLLTG